MILRVSPCTCMMIDMSWSVTKSPILTKKLKQTYHALCVLFILFVFIVCFSHAQLHQKFNFFCFMLTGLVMLQSKILTDLEKKTPMPPLKESFKATQMFPSFTENEWCWFYYKDLKIQGFISNSSTVCSRNEGEECLLWWPITASRSIRQWQSAI